MKARLVPGSQQIMTLALQIKSLGNGESFCYDVHVLIHCESDKRYHSKKGLAKTLNWSTYTINALLAKRCNIGPDNPPYQPHLATCDFLLFKQKISAIISSNQHVIQITVYRATKICTVWLDTAPDLPGA